MNQKQTEVLCIAKDAMIFAEKISRMNIISKQEQAQALFLLNRLIIEARLIMKGGGPTAQANSEVQYHKLGI